jgi:hypothetical protein
VELCVRDRGAIEAGVQEEEERYAVDFSGCDDVAVGGVLGDLPVIDLCFERFVDGKTLKRILPFFLLLETLVPEFADRGDHREEILGISHHRSVNPRILELFHEWDTGVKYHGFIIGVGIGGDVDYGYEVGVELQEKAGEFMVSLDGIRKNKMDEGGASAEMMEYCSVGVASDGL